MFFYLKYLKILRIRERTGESFSVLQFVHNLRRNRSMRKGGLRLSSFAFAYDIISHIFFFISKNNY
jgi:hypothetical protein